MSAKRPVTRGADRLALERAGADAADIALGDGDAEMVRPERDQPFDEANRRGAGAGQPRHRLGAKNLLFDRLGRFGGRRGGRERGGHHCRRHRLRRRRRDDLDDRGDIGRGHAEPGEAHSGDALARLFLAILIRIHRLQGERRAQQRRIVDFGGVRRVQFGKKRCSRIAGSRQIARARPKTEPVEGDDETRIGVRHGPKLRCAPTRPDQTRQSWREDGRSIVEADKAALCAAAKNRL
jgi:hypothetical protein